jgi:hypothetical protein
MNIEKGQLGITEPLLPVAKAVAISGEAISSQERCSRIDVAVARIKEWGATFAIHSGIPMFQIWGLTFLEAKFDGLDQSQLTSETFEKFRALAQAGICNWHESNEVSRKAQEFYQKIIDAHASFIGKGLKSSEKNWLLETVRMGGDNRPFVIPSEIQYTVAAVPYQFPESTSTFQIQMPAMPPIETVASLRESGRLHEGVTAGKTASLKKGKVWRSAIPFPAESTPKPLIEQAMSYKVEDSPNFKNIQRRLMFLSKLGKEEQKQQMSSIVGLMDDELGHEFLVYAGLLLPFMEKKSAFVFDEKTKIWIGQKLKAKASDADPEIRQQAQKLLGQLVDLEFVSEWDTLLYAF